MLSERGIFIHFSLVFSVGFWLKPTLLMNQPPKYWFLPLKWSKLIKLKYSVSRITIFITYLKEIEKLTVDEMSGILVVLSSDWKVGFASEV